MPRVPKEKYLTIISRPGREWSKEEIDAVFMYVENEWTDSFYRLAGYIGKCGRDQAQDHVQTGYVNAIGAIRTFDPAKNKSPKDKFKAWLSTIIIRVVLSALRVCRTDIDIDDVLEDEMVKHSPRNPEQLAEENEDRNRIRILVQELPPKYEDMIDLYYWQDKSIAEIAEMRNMTQENVKVRLHRARRMLKAALAIEDNEQTHAVGGVT